MRLELLFVVDRQFVFVAQPHHLSVGMEKEVGRWLHQQLGYNAAADGQLSANCRGNLKTLWEFLMHNYKTPENQRHIQHVLSKHRREQELARTAPERQKEALKQRQHLHQLEAKAVALQRTLASFQAAAESNIQDAAEQTGEQGLFKHDLHETQTQVLVLQAAMHRVRQLLPVLQAKLKKLQAIAEMAKARCQVTGGNRRMQSVLHQLQQVSDSIRLELMESLEGGMLQQHSNAVPAATDQSRQLDQLQQQDQGTEAASGAAAAADASGGLAPNSWEDLKVSAIASDLQQLAQCNLVSGYRPSQDVRSTTLQLLQEPPDMLLTCTSQLAAQAGHELNAILDEAEMSLLAPVGWGGAQDTQQQQLVQHGGKGTGPVGQVCPYTLPWTTTWFSGGIPGSAAGQQQQQQQNFQSPEVLVKQRQQMHVQLYVKAKEALAAAAAADKELTRLLGTTPLLRQQLGDSSSSWEAQLACLWLRAEGLRGEVAVLQQRKAEFEQDVDACLQAEAQLQEKWQQIEAAVAEDTELNQLLWQVAADNMQLFAALWNQQEQVLHLLRQQLVPCSGAAAQCAEAGRDELQREVAVVGRLPVAALPHQRLAAAGMGTGGTAGVSSSGSSSVSGSSQLSTLARLQLAAQRLSHLGRPTTAPKAFAAAAQLGSRGGAATAGRHGGAAAGAVVDSNSSCSGVDGTAVAALRAAAGIDAVAPGRCPAALLLEVAEDCQQLRQLQQQLMRLGAVSKAAAASSSKAAEQAGLLAEQVHELRSKEQQQVLPWLHDMLDICQQQRAYAQKEVTADINHFLEMPAQHLLPNHKYEGKNCSDWLMEIQALHGRKRELSSQRAG